MMKDYRTSELVSRIRGILDRGKPIDENEGIWPAAIRQMATDRQLCALFVTELGLLLQHFDPRPKDAKGSSDTP